MTCLTSETQRRAYLIRIGSPCLYCVLLCVAGNCTGKETPQRELVPSELDHKSGYRHAGGAVAVKPQYTGAKPLSEGPQTDLNALRTRVLLGVSPYGTPKQQVEFLYKSPQLKHKSISVWAGTEGKLLKQNERACYVEVPASSELGKRGAPDATRRGWLPVARKRTVFDVIDRLSGNRKRSNVTVKLRCQTEARASGEAFHLVAAFTNSDETVKTVHFGPVCLRDSSTGAPVPDLGSENAKTTTKDIPPHKTVTISRRLVPTLPERAPRESYVAYALFSIREGPGGPVPIGMVSEFAEVTFASAETGAGANRHLHGRRELRWVKERATVEGTLVARVAASFGCNRKREMLGERTARLKGELSTLARQQPARLTYGFRITVDRAKRDMLLIGPEDEDI
jgi:hypothetical protein